MRAELSRANGPGSLRATVAGHLLTAAVPKTEGWLELSV
jgi:hypothetical protein